MTLKMFMATTMNKIGKVTIADGWDSKTIIYEGTYSDFADKIHELNLAECIVFRWELNDTDLYVEIDNH